MQLYIKTDDTKKQKSLFLRTEIIYSNYWKRTWVVTEENIEI